jgi:pimeloyl-ACP methyl ester carboxylesterase
VATDEALTRSWCPDGRRLLPVLSAIEPLRVPTALGTVAVHELGAGLPTVLWHDLFVDGSSWGYVAPQLLTGRRLLLVDGPGWGRSDRLPARAQPDAALAAAIAVLGALAPGTAVDWVGNGWGGRIGMELAATRPDLVRSLVAIASSPRPLPPEDHKRLRGALPLLYVAGPVPPVARAIFANLLTEESRTEPGTVGAVVDALALAGSRSRTRAVRAFLLNRPDLTDLLPRIEAPSLFVAGGDGGDWRPERAERDAALAPFARAVAVPGSRGLIPLERPGRLAALVGEFWSSLEMPS